MPRGLKIEATPRNDFEAAGAAQLKAAGIAFRYENERIPVNIPARTAAYIPDFVPDDTNIILEFKGRFGGVGKHGDEKSGAQVRAKMVLTKAQHPERDIRFVFQNPNNRIYKGSKTTYAKWADDHGFKWAHKTIPPEWIKEILKQQGRSSDRSHQGNQSRRAASKTSRSNAAARTSNLQQRSRVRGAQRTYSRTTASRVRHHNPSRRRDRV